MKINTTVLRQQVINDVLLVFKKSCKESITRDYYVKHGQFTMWNIKQAGFDTFKECKAACGLLPTRVNKKVAAKRVKSQMQEAYSKWYKTQVLPWVGKYKKNLPKKGVVNIAVLSDVHSHYADKMVLATFYDFCKRRQPDQLIVVGDLFDWREFNKAASDDVRQMKLEDEIAFAHEFWSTLRRISPKTHFVLVTGNHDNYVLNALYDSHTPLARLMAAIGVTYSQLLCIDKYNVELFSKKDLLTWNMKEERAAERNNIYDIYDKLVCFTHYPVKIPGTHCLTGHTHKLKVNSEANIVNKYINITMGCVAETGPEYTNQDNYVNGFHWLWIKPKERKVSHEIIVDTDGFIVRDGMVYER